MPALTDFQSEGLEIDCLAQITSGVNVQSGGISFYTDAAGTPWDTSGLLTDGELGIGEGDAGLLTRIMYTGSSTPQRIRFNDNGGPPLSLNNYFGGGGPGADLTVWFQTDAETISIPVSVRISSSGDNWLNMDLEAAEESFFESLSTSPGTEFLFALTRTVPPVSAPGSLGFGPVSLSGIAVVEMSILPPSATGALAVGPLRLDGLGLVQVLGSLPAAGEVGFGPLGLAGQVSVLSKATLLGALNLGPATLAGVLSVLQGISGPPTFVRAVATGFNSLDASWQSPLLSGREAVDHYEVQVDDGPWENVGNVSRSRIYGLAIWSHYSIRVRAVTSLGPGIVALPVTAQVRRIGFRLLFPGATIPVRNLGRQAFTVRLSDVDCRITLWWQSTDMAWYATVEAPAGIGLVAGRRLVNDANLLSRVDSPLAGSLMVRLLSSETLPIGRNPWGNTHVLRYETG